MDKTPICAPHGSPHVETGDIYIINPHPRAHSLWANEREGILVKIVRDEGNDVCSVTPLTNHRLMRLGSNVRIYKHQLARL